MTPLQVVGPYRCMVCAVYVEGDPNEKKLPHVAEDHLPEWTRVTGQPDSVATWAMVGRLHAINLAIREARTQ